MSFGELSDLSCKLCNSYSVLIHMYSQEWEKEIQKTEDLSFVAAVLP